MKIIKFSFLALVIIFFSSCNGNEEEVKPVAEEQDIEETSDEEEDPSEEEEVEEKPYSATVNGEPWVAVSIVANLWRPMNSDEPGNFSIKGVAADNTAIDITIPEDAVPGTYSLAEWKGCHATFFPDKDGATDFFSTEGELKIISYDKEAKTMEAEFFFTATSKSDDKVYKVENGKFFVEKYVVR